MSAAPIVVPELGAEGAPIRISTWLVDPGQAVLEGDRVVELLLPGMTFDVAAPAAGVLARVEKVEQTLVAPGDVLGWIEPAPPS